MHSRWTNCVKNTTLNGNSSACHGIRQVLRVDCRCVMLPFWEQYNRIMNMADMAMQVIGILVLFGAIEAVLG